MKTIFKKIIIKLLIIESRLVLKKYKPKIIAVTGSVGKTSTKDAIYTVISSINHIRKSEKSFNSDIGIPLTILGCQNGWSDAFIWFKNLFIGLELIIFKSEYPKCLILEVGADHPHDIENVCKWLKPDIAVITKIGEIIPVHIEFFNSPEAVFAEKMFLAKALKKDGTLILLSDDKRLMEACKDIKQKILSFGIINRATVTASNIEILYKENNDIKIPDGMTFKINYTGNSIPFNINNVLGNQQIYPILAAITVGIAYEISISKIIESLKKHVFPNGRMKIISGINDSTIIDDSYNSSPIALSEALLTLSSIKISDGTFGKKIAVIGDMMELGKFSAEEHKKAGELSIKSCDILITVGPRAKQMNENAKHFNSSIEVGEYLKSIVQKGDIILIKGSQSMRMEHIAKILLLEQDKSADLLVRQEPEWLAKV